MEKAFKRSRGNQDPVIASEQQRRGLPPGFKIDDFEITSFAGQGGMGIVYKARQRSLERDVALKILLPHLSLSENALLKFRREAEAGGRQRHPGIVSVHSAGKQNGIHYIAQEWVEGGRTLAELIKASKDDPSRPAGYYRNLASIVANVADALHHAHESGVIHRDVKPTNILLKENLKPKVTDFGLARVEDALALSRTGDLFGTPYYMSPEQAVCSKSGVTRQTDVYSLGVTLYELITSRIPFQGETSHEVLKKIISSDPIDPRKIDPRVPRDLSAICLKAMEKDVRKRYHSMREFGDDLRRYLSGDVIHAKAPHPVVRFLKMLRQHPVVSTGTGVFLVLVIVFSIFFSWYSSEIELEKNIYSDSMIVAGFREEANNLWPAVPEKVQEMEQWLEGVKRLSKRLPAYKARLKKLSSMALPRDDAAEKQQRERDPLWKRYLEVKQWPHYQQYRDLVSKHGTLPQSSMTSDEEGRLNYWYFKIEKYLFGRKIWSFADEADRRTYEVLQKTVEILDDLAAEKWCLRWEVEQRLDFARRVYTDSIGFYNYVWKQAINSIKDEVECPLYKGLVLRPQLGLVPLGRDPDSGLWEFVHLQTGMIPERRKDGKLIYTKECGIVFVLLPGGCFDMGAVRPTEDRPKGSPNVDPFAEELESPVIQVTLKPFFISKYELTSSQWYRINKRELWGDLKLRFDCGLRPMQSIDWYECEEFCRRADIRLPTEAEWEYAARAGTTTIWWTGDTKESIVGAANILDLTYCRQNKGNIWEKEAIWFDDGHIIPAPVGTYLANPFGLHDVIGNAEEWCQDDGFYCYDAENAPRDGSPFIRKYGQKIRRGGSNQDVWWDTRSAYRNNGGSIYNAPKLGMRPARSIDTDRAPDS